MHIAQKQVRCEQRSSPVPVAPLVDPTLRRGGGLDPAADSRRVRTGRSDCRIDAAGNRTGFHHGHRPHRAGSDHTGAERVLTASLTG